MIRIAIPLTLAAVLAFLACGSTTAELPVRSEYDKTADFSGWNTFRFASDGKDADHTRYPKYERHAQQALEDELTSRGYTRIEEGSPDFRVAFDLVFRGDTQPQMTPEGGGAEPQPKSYSGSRQTGTLIVKMLDPKSSEILWTGQISELKMNTIEPQKEFQKAVWRLLAEFPPLNN
jgi:hypothetical protein